MTPKYYPEHFYYELFNYFNSLNYNFINFLGIVQVEYKDNIVANDSFKKINIDDIIDIDIYRNGLPYLNDFYCFFKNYCLRYPENITTAFKYNKTHTQDDYYISVISNFNINHFNHITNSTDSMLTVFCDRNNIDLYFNCIINNQKINYNDKLNISHELYSTYSKIIESHYYFFSIRDTIFNYFKNDIDKFKEFNLLKSYSEEKKQIDFIHSEKMNSIFLENEDIISNIVIINKAKIIKEVQIYGVLEHDYIKLFDSLYKSLSTYHFVINKTIPIESKKIITNNLHFGFNVDSNIELIKNTFIDFIQEHRKNKIILSFIKQQDKETQWADIDNYILTWTLKHYSLKNKDQHSNTHKI